jgi:hypothetical protein
MAEVQSEIQFGDNLEMLFVEAPFDKSKAAIEGAGGEVSDAQRIAQARLVAPIEHHIWQYGSNTSINVIYVPGKRINIWTKVPYSPIMNHPVEATQAHENNEEYFVLQDKIKKILGVAKEDKNKSPLEQRVHIEKRVKDFEIPTNKKFAKDPLMQFNFGADAEKYGARLAQEGISEMPVILVDDFEDIDAQANPFSRALWLRSADDGSGLDSDDRDLYFGARGVRKVAPTGAAQNLYEAIAKKYGFNSPEEVDKALSLVKQIRRL